MKPINDDISNYQKYQEYRKIIDKQMYTKLECNKTEVFYGRLIELIEFSSEEIGCKTR